MQHFHLSILPLLASLFTSLAGAAEKPNILFIVSDDQGYADVGFHGCKDIPTPGLDALAARGVRFSNGYVTGPYCSPTRAGLMTGRYQQRFGHEFNPTGNQGIPTTEKTIADHLKGAGYVTGLVGKWHLGSLPAMHPRKRGFDEFFGFLGGAHSYFQSNGFMRDDNPVEKIGYATDEFAKEAVSFISRHEKQPWFLYLAFNAVHTPMDATQDRLAKFSAIKDPRRRAYAAMLSAMDDAVCQVEKALADSGQASRTLVFFFSDNGGPTMNGVTVNGASNLPLRGSKRTTLEGGVRVPFVMAWPGQIKPGVFSKPVIQLDATVTALTAAGLSRDSVGKLDGVDLLPFLSGSNSGSPHEALYWRFGEQMAIRKDDFKLVRYDGNADTQVGKKQETSSAKLYHLGDDPGETKDLSGSMPEKVTELQAKWDAWNHTLVPPLWGGASAGKGKARQKKGGVR